MDIIVNVIRFERMFGLEFVWISFFKVNKTLILSSAAAAALFT